MNHKRLISLTACLILATVLGTSSLVLADVASETDTKAEQHFEKANELRKVADYDAAIAEYEKAISLSPNSKIAQDAQYWVGQLYFESKQFDAALSAFQKLLDEYPASRTIPATTLMIKRVQQAQDTQLLVEAVGKGNINLVKSLIARGANINEKNDRGMTPLHEAAYYGREDMAEVLIANGANVNTTNESGQTPLHLAAKIGVKYVPELLLANGADINARNNNGGTPLHNAVQQWDVTQDLLELLLAKGADVNARNNKGQTPLHSAAPWTYFPERHPYRAAYFLLAHGAEVNAKDSSGCTPLHLAAHNGQKQVVELLLTKGADIEAKAADGTTALLSALNGEDDSHYDVMEFLLDKGADINAARSDGLTALHIAAEYGIGTFVELLISRGADVNAQSRDGETPLDRAALTSSVKICDLLIAKGAKVHGLHSTAIVGDLAKVKSFVNEGCTTAEKEFALCAAAACGHGDVVSWLISQGVPANARNKRNRSALMCAAAGGGVDVARRLLVTGADVSSKASLTKALGFAAYFGQKEVVELLIANGADVNRQGTPSIFDGAVFTGNKEIADLLLEKGAVQKAVPAGVCMRGWTDTLELLIKKSADINSGVLRGYPPSFFAVWYDHPDTLGRLLTHGADANAEDRRGWSLLHYAVVFPDITKLLLEKGANPNAVERARGQTPLHVAASGYNEGRDYKTMPFQRHWKSESVEPSVELLIKYGANVNTKDWEGNTPLALAQEKGYAEIVELLKNGSKEKPE